MRRPVKATETESGLFLLVNERLRMRLPSFYRPTEDLTTNLKPGARRKNGELWWGVTWHSRSGSLNGQTLRDTTGRISNTDKTLH